MRDYLLFAALLAALFYLRHHLNAFLRELFEVLGRGDD